MIKNKLKECCNYCNSIDIKTDSGGHFNAYGDLVDIKVYIHCAHSEVCKKYLDEIRSTSTIVWTPFTTEDEVFDNLKDHYWYLIVDDRFGTPVKAKWHSDACQFTYLVEHESIECPALYDDPQHIQAYAELCDCSEIRRNL